MKKAFCTDETQGAIVCDGAVGEVENLAKATGAGAGYGERGPLRLLLGLLDSEASPAWSSGESQSPARLDSGFCRAGTPAITHRL